MSKVFLAIPDVSLLLICGSGWGEDMMSGVAAAILCL